MSDYVIASEAVDRLHRRLVAAEQERDELMSVVRRIGHEASSGDAHLAQSIVLRLVNQTVKAWEVRREAF